MLRDPPDLKQYQARGNPPPNLWPGRFRTREDIMAATGDERDWFRYGHRLAAYRRAVGAFVTARRARRKLVSNFEWNQVLIIGEYGASKSTLQIKAALDKMWLGHATFFNASFLCGWYLQEEEMYTALSRLPKASVMGIDETSAHLSGIVAHSVAVTAYSDNNLNTRKQNGMVIYSSAHDWEIAPSIRAACKEVWMPVKIEDLDVERAEYDTGRRIRPAEDPDRFRLAWHVWDKYPYKRANLIEGGRDAKREGFGPPTRTMYDDGNRVRDAFLLNDTFELAKAGAARIADRDAIREDLEAAAEGRQPRRRKNEKTERMHAIMQHLQEAEPHVDEYITASEIGRAVGIDPRVAGTLLRQMVPNLRNVQNKGYSTELIYEHLDYLTLEVGEV